MSTYDVFISYSRKDTDFVRELFNALSAEQRPAWVDWQGIDYSTKWWEEICTGIERAHNFVLIVSPDSLNSVYCHREIEHARKIGKRIVTLLYRPVDEAELVGGWYTHKDMRPIEPLARANWEHLKTIQWIDLGKLNGDATAGAKALLQTVDTDPECVQAHTQLLQQTLYWENSGRSPGALLSGDVLTLAEKRLQDCAPKISFNDGQKAFVTESRKAEAERARRIKEDEQRTKRLRLITVVAGIIGVLAVLATGGAVNQTQIARNEAATAIANANEANQAVAIAGATLSPIPPTLTAVAEQVIEGEAQIASLDLASKAAEILSQPEGNRETAALLAIRALNIDYTPQADADLVKAVDGLFTRQSLSEHTFVVNSAAYSPDGVYIVTSSWNNTVRVWDAVSGEEVRMLSGHTLGVNSAAYSPDGQFIVTASLDGTARIWDADYRDFVAYACTRVFREDLTEDERRVYGITDDSPTCPQFAKGSGQAAGG